MNDNCNSCTFQKFVPSKPTDAACWITWACSLSGSWPQIWFSQISLRFLRFLQIRLLRFLQWVILLSPSLCFAFCDSGGVVGTIASEEWRKNIIRYLSLPHTVDNKDSRFLPERVCISHSLPFITGTYRSFSCSPWCPWPGLIPPGF